jgi:hypothetical protein
VAPSSSDERTRLLLKHIVTFISTILLVSGTCLFHCGWIYITKGVSLTEVGSELFQLEESPNMVAAFSKW